MVAFPVPTRGRRLTVRARAKVNLGLEVLGRRPDGYHQLLTLLWAVTLHDRVTLETRADGIEIECDTPGIPLGPDNLAWRAAELVRRTGRVQHGVRIRIHKTIPVAGGLGGGSADGAAVLVGLTHLWRLDLTPDRLRALAVRLGMDVPFFLGGGPAVGSGRGDRLRALPRHPGLTLVLVNPGVPISTRDVYAGLRPDDFTRGRRIRALVAALPGGARTVAVAAFNGLERVVTRIWPGLLDVKAALLEAGALGAVMSGSGATVVGIAGSRRAAQGIQTRLASRPWQSWVVRTVSGPALTSRWSPT